MSTQVLYFLIFKQIYLNNVYANKIGSVTGHPDNYVAKSINLKPNG